MEERAQLQLELSREKDIRSHRILKTKGQKSKAFWREIKPRGSTKINSLKREDGSQTTSPEETVMRAHEYFQKLFTKKEGKGRQSTS